MLKKLIHQLAWLQNDCPGFHFETNFPLKNKFENSDIVIYHDKTPDFEYVIKLNSGKSIIKANKIMQCWANGIFEPSNELELGC